jgi:hypothetical protein
MATPWGHASGMDVYEIVGWLGAVMVLGAYILVTRTGMPSVIYQVLNLAGAIGLLVNALHHHAFPSTTVNAVWCVIAVWGFTVASRRRRARLARTRG